MPLDDHISDYVSLSILVVGYVTGGNIEHEYLLLRKTIFSLGFPFLQRKYFLSDTSTTLRFYSSFICLILLWFFAVLILLSSFAMVVVVLCCTSHSVVVVLFIFFCLLGFFLTWVP